VISAETKAVPVLADGPDQPSGIQISVISPAYNEEGNIAPLHQRLVEALEPLGRTFEVVYVDDGSRDGTFAEMAELAETDPRARVVQLRRNFGQTAAIAAGIDHASGRILVFIDADLQNDPQDIPSLLALLEEGYDVASGWRKERKEPALSRRWPSKMANALISRLTGVYLHDYGCTLKAYRAELLQQVSLYGEMHRFIPAYLALIGAKVAELPVRHAPRQRGQSKYGLGRIFKVVLDLVTLKFLGSFGTKPSYAFGGLGMLCLVLSFLVGIGMVWQKIALGTSFIQTPLLLLSALLFLMGFQVIMIGLLAELVMRTYHESQGKRTYVVRRVLNP
jgi:glycosyltransferase involved in cell wall biosynthesis